MRTSRTSAGANGRVAGSAQKDLERGISGVQKALTTFRNYNGSSFVQQPAAPEVHQSSSGARTGLGGTFARRGRGGRWPPEAHAAERGLQGTGREVQGAEEHWIEEISQRVGQRQGFRERREENLAKLNDICVAKAMTHEENPQRCAMRIAQGSVSLILVVHSCTSVVSSRVIIAHIIWMCRCLES